MTSSSIPENIQVPPDDLKKVIDKTVDYVIKNGSTFEERLKKNESKGSKFTFLLDDDQYHPYYKWKLNYDNDSKEGSEEVNPESKSTGEDTKTASVTPPRTLHFLTELPPLSLLDLKIIKLSALAVAVNGPEYEKALISKKKGVDPEFDFLEKGHSLYDIFQKYIQQYKIVLALFEDKKAADIQGIWEDLQSPDDLLQISFQRAAFNKQNKTKKKRVKEAEEEKQIAYASIDWQDFAFVEKVEFDAIDEVKELDAPISRDELLYRSLQSKKQALFSEENRQTTTERTKEEHDESSNVPHIQESDSSERDKEIARPKGMKIKAAGTSRLKNKSLAEGQDATKEPTIKCPITGRLIPQSKFDTHLKILLRDPRYKQQQENFLKKNFSYSSNLSTDEVYDNIKRLMKKRELAGTEDESQTKKLKETNKS
ncbi:Piso0_005813 [Millerozyma farinosa CBS 7064]|uniref:Piso0_005813 protein n=1 Tax=Pichia sorbitophila (strain ATCC MYA-4447 / BCRC 22081 / CBS 7064 / NBRC 10061 / NRRL Y-12695) TaxID=559304 RepID=G8Y008_PICSO|nr:Piso0_005813 [Millerozyma farinosa CBS 7064]